MSSYILDHVSFDIRRGEVLAVAGVQGNGQTELAEAVLGLVTPDGGKIELDGKSISGQSVRHIIDSGVGFIPEDRTKDGAIASLSHRGEPHYRSVSERAVRFRPGNAPGGSPGQCQPTRRRVRHSPDANHGILSQLSREETPRKWLWHANCRAICAFS